jgi:exodeoxyribonuclease VII large subunit
VRENERQALSVGELDRAIKRSLDVSFDRPVWVEGEVAGARPAPGGHLYFALKDDREEALIDVAIYKTNITPGLRKMVVDGARLQLRGRPTFWAPRGRLQLVADRAEPIGKGALLLALLRLKDELAKEGLFDAARKRRIPSDPRVIGVVTSKSGAAIHDICRVAFRRGGARILLAPAIVQGAGAGMSMQRAIRELTRVRWVDVIIIGRGGGSSEDLMAFNDEGLVRAVAGCPVPVISAVGHEVDTTLTDFAADARAATPSQAAEMVVPDLRARRQALSHTQTRLRRAMYGRIDGATSRLARALRALGDPRLALAGSQQTLDDRISRLEAGIRRPLGARGERLVSLERKLARLHPSVRLGEEAQELARLSARMEMRALALLRDEERRLGHLVSSLDAMSPLRVLGRGYAIATTDGGRAVRSSEDVRVGDAIHVRVASGRIDVEVTGITPGDPASSRHE